MPNHWGAHRNAFDLDAALKEYLRATSSTRRPTDRDEARTTSRPRRALAHTMATAGLALILGGAVWLGSTALDRRHVQGTPSTRPGTAAGAVPTRIPQLIFGSAAETASGWTTDFWALPFPGGTPHVIDAFPTSTSGPVWARLVVAGYRFVVTTDAAQRLSIADLSAGTSRVLDIGRVTSGALDPSETHLAVDVFHGRGPVDLDIVNLMDLTVVHLRTTPLNAAMSPYRWLTDGIHVATVDYLAT